MSFNVAKVRQDFPIFERTIRDGKKLVYLDSGATSQNLCRLLMRKATSISFTMLPYTEGLIS